MGVRHGDTPGLSAEALLSDDPDLENVHADLNEWADAHPCECEALCECDE